MNFQLILLHEAGLRQELANVLSLIALQLQNLAIFGMFDHSTVASKLLKCDKSCQFHPRSQLL